MDADRHLNPELKENLKAIFAKLDQDHNGSVDRQEFTKLLVESGKDKQLSEKQWDLLFSLVRFVLLVFFLKFIFSNLFLSSMKTTMVALIIQNSLKEWNLNFQIKFKKMNKKDKIQFSYCILFNTKIENYHFNSNTIDY
jgi:hypothetical protein